MSHTLNLAGVLAVDKPPAMTSRDVVNCIQRLLRYPKARPNRNVDQNLIDESSAPQPSLPPEQLSARLSARPPKLGHTGTLDPMATGVLLVVIGSATRMVEYAHQLSKTYEADFVLGVTSDTLDSTGNVEELPSPPSILRDELVRELENWVGHVQQTPPKYSAIHVAGQRAYDLARRGSDFDLPAREVSIHNLELLNFEYPRFSLRICCSTGTYIRSLGSDIAVALGSNAVMSRLVRTSIGPFHLEKCVNLDDLRSPQDVEKSLLSPQGLLQELFQLQLNDQSCALLRQGKSLEWSLSWGCEPSVPNEIAVFDLQDRPVAIVKLHNRLLRPIRVFNC